MLVGDRTFVDVDDPPSRIRWISHYRADFQFVVPSLRSRVAIFDLVTIIRSVPRALLLQSSVCTRRLLYPCHALHLSTTPGYHGGFSLNVERFQTLVLHVTHTTSPVQVGMELTQ